MKKIFEKGEFSSPTYSNFYEANMMLESARESIYEYSEKTTVFISHKHSDLEDLKGVIDFLEKQYAVKAYIDSRDPSMPTITSGQTAENIKNRIKQCNKFILLATNGAIESKWCNWELGFGDAQKYQGNIALLPMKDRNQDDAQYKGSEYMDIYPSIVRFKQYQKMPNGETAREEYYVKIDDQYVTLHDWFRFR